MSAVAVRDLRLDGDGALYQQIRRALARPILDGRWPPGLKLPSEHALTDLLGASRMTVNKAIAQLAQEGLVVRRRKAGTFVASQTEEHALLRISDVAEEIAAASHTYRYALRHTRKLRLPAAAERDVGLTPGGEVLMLECLHYADDTPAMLEERWIDLTAVPMAGDADFATEPPGPWLIRRVPWSEAQHTIQAHNAGAREAAALAIAKGAACLVVERRTWQESGRLRQPVTFVRMTYPGDRHRLVGRFRPGVG